MQLILKKQQPIVVLAFLLPILVLSSMYVSQSAAPKILTSNNLHLASSTTNYTVGVLPSEEYTWIVTSLYPEKLELV